MEALFTTLAFVALSAVLMWLHVRGTRRGRPAAPTASCPRCRATVAKGADFCAGCGAPLQAFEMVMARVVPDGATAGGDGPRHALVRADLCVGCGTCVAACPEPGAIRLVGKLATVDKDRCVGHGSCAEACPVGGIVVTTGAAVQHVEVPMVSAHFETTVDGLHVVGELGGRGLIKNAVNEGRIAVEHIARTLTAGRGAGDAFDVAIVGSGPAGLSAGLEALSAGLSYVILEQGTLSESIRRYPRHKLLLAEPVNVPMYGDLWIADASKEELLAVWENVIAKTGLEVRTGERVTAIEREADGAFRLDATNGSVRARRVVLAMGRRGTPRRLGVPGESSDHVFYDIVEMEAFAGMRALVVGGGDSAIESALGLANQSGTTVTLSYRGDAFPRVKERNRTKLDAAVAAGRVTLLLGSQVREIRAGVTALEWQGRPHLVPSDVVIVRIGGEPPYEFLKRLGVLIVRKEVAIADAAPAATAVGG